MLARSARHTVKAVHGLTTQLGHLDGERPRFRTMSRVIPAAESSARCLESTAWYDISGNLHPPSSGVTMGADDDGGASQLCDSQ